MLNRRLLPQAAAILCGLAAACARADEGDAISTDRPGFVESSQTVGKGRLQLETSLQWDRQRDDELHTHTLSTPTLLRIGLGESTELRFETDGRTVIHASEPSGGLRTTVAGYADTEIGIKWHLADPRGEGMKGRPSLGLLLHAALPSGSRALRGHGLRPSLRLAADWDLAQGTSFSLMPGLATDSDEDGRRYGYAILAANLGREFSERLRGFVEVAAPQVAASSHGGTQTSVDGGLVYQVSKDCQLDVWVVHGLDRRSPDLSLAFGLSLRR